MAQLVPLTQQKQKQKQKQTSSVAQTIIQQKTQFQPPKLNDTDQYLNHFLNVIRGYLGGYLKKDSGEIVDIHNKEEAKRLLSFFNNEYEKNKSQLRTANILQKRYKELMADLANLETLQALNLELNNVSDQIKKQQLRKKIQQLQNKIPEAYKNNEIPSATIGSMFSSLFSGKKKPTIVAPQQAAKKKPDQQITAIQKDNAQKLKKALQQSKTNVQNETDPAKKQKLRQEIKQLQKDIGSKKSAFAWTLPSWPWRSAGKNDKNKPSAAVQQSKTGAIVQAAAQDQNVKKALQTLRTLIQKETDQKKKQQLKKMSQQLKNEANQVKKKQLLKKIQQLQTQPTDLIGMGSLQADLAQQQRLQKQRRRKQNLQTNMKSNELQMAIVGGPPIGQQIQPPTPTPAPAATNRQQGNSGQNQQSANRQQGKSGQNQQSANRQQGKSGQNQQSAAANRQQKQQNMLDFNAWDQASQKQKLQKFDDLTAQRTQGNKKSLAQVAMDDALTTQQLSQILQN